MFMATRTTERRSFGMIDEINHPPHYNDHPSGIECIEIVEHFNFNIGNAIKYTWRAGLKTPDPKQDLRKAIWYLNREIERRERYSVRTDSPDKGVAGDQVLQLPLSVGSPGYNQP